MEEQIQIQKKSNVRRYAILGAVLLTIALVSAAVIYQSIAVDITINEALSTATTTVSVPSIYPGETHTETITINNAASNNLNTQISWTEGSNPNGVTYTTNMPQDVALAPGANVITVTYTINTDSPTGTFAGNIVLTRTA